MAIERQQSEDRTTLLDRQSPITRRELLPGPRLVAQPTGEKLSNGPMPGQEPKEGGVILTFPTKQAEHESLTQTEDASLPNIEIGRMATLKYIGREIKKKVTRQDTNTQDSFDSSVRTLVTQEERTTDVRALVDMLRTIQGNASAYAHRRSTQDLANIQTVSPFERESLLKDMHGQHKSNAMIAQFQLIEIERMPKEQRDKVMPLYRSMWGEYSNEFEQLFKRSLQEYNQASESTEQAGTTRSNAADVLGDFDIPIERKIEMLTRAGFTPKEAAKAVLFTGAAAVATLAISTAAEGGAAASALAAVVDPQLEGLQLPNSTEAILSNMKSLGVDAAMFGGFYATTFVYAKLHARMTEMTGLGMNAFATGVHYIDKALGVAQDEIRKDMIKTVFIVNLALDAPYLATIVIPEVGTSMMANAYKFGIQITAAQAAVCAAVVGGAKLKEYISNKNAAQKTSPTLESNPIPSSQPTGD